MGSIRKRKYRKVVYTNGEGELGYIRILPKDRVALMRLYKLLRTLGLHAGVVDLADAVQFIKTQHSYKKKKKRGHIFKPSKSK